MIKTRLPNMYKRRKSANVLLNFANVDELMESLGEKLSSQFKNLEKIAVKNQAKIQKAFTKHKLSAAVFKDETGYGIDNWSRLIVDDIYATVFHGVKACVRLGFVSGTHALAVAFQANLKPNDNLISLTGRLYDSLDPVIGYYKEHKASLKSLGVNYHEFNFIDKESGHDFDLSKDDLALILKDTSLVYIQKSAGYATWRKSISNQAIGRLIEMVRSLNKNCLVLVDNCYGEFVEEIEPLEVGANLIVGSLIKNPGGGLAISGGYIVGDEEIVDNCLTRITAPGIEGNQGLNFNQTRLLLQGLYLAPMVVMNAVKMAHLFALAFSELGFMVIPDPLATRYDLIQTIILNSENRLIKFCQKLQECCPVDSFIRPEPALLPGYQDKVIMAGGGFVDGSTLELSADGPLRPPYAVYLQGGLSWPHSQLVLLEMLKANFIDEFTQN